MGARRRLGIAGVVLGTASAGLAVSTAAKRYAMGRIWLRPDSTASEPFGELRGRPVTLVTSDGVELYLEVHEPASSANDLTLVFCHGYTLNQDSWHYQRRSLTDQGRLIVWDHRCHGRSGRCQRADARIDRLGEDLYEILSKLVPGPAVLAGHSMGGMTIMALADQHPELFGEKVLGVALISTSAGKMAGVTFGLPALAGKLVSKAIPPVFNTLGRRARLVDSGRELARDLGFLTIRRLAFGDPKAASPTLVDFAESMIRATPMDVVADFYPALMSHDKLAALDVLNTVPTTIVIGERDLITPVDHSRAIAEAVPDAELVEVKGAGHLVMLERPDTVNEALRRLVARIRRPSKRRRVQSRRSA